MIWRSIFFAIAGIFFTSCSREVVAQKLADRAVQKTSPNFVVSYLYGRYRLPENVKTDTLYVERYVYEVDTFISVHDSTVINRDTIYLTKEKLNVRVIRHNDTIRITGTCISDTVYVEKIKLVNNSSSVTVEHRTWPIIKYLITISFILLLLWVAWRFLIRFLKQNF